MRKNNNSDRVFANNDIRAKEVRCIDHEGNNLGVIKTQDAIYKAKNIGLDLVLVSQGGKNQPPTCKFLDYGKYKYEMSKKRKELAKKQRESLIKIKEIKFRPCTDDSDLLIKAKKAQGFINEGHRLKVTVNFKGRESNYYQIAKNKLDYFISSLKDIEMYEDPQMSSKQLVCVLQKKELN